MSANLNEIMLHIDETLDDDAMYRLEEDMRTDSGVVSVGHNARQSHMIMVVYDSESCGTGVQLAAPCGTHGLARTDHRALNPRGREDMEESMYFHYLT